jgi:hypothetical protein
LGLVVSSGEGQGPTERPAGASNNPGPEVALPARPTHLPKEPPPTSAKERKSALKVHLDVGSVGSVEEVWNLAIAVRTIEDQVLIAVRKLRDEAVQDQFGAERTDC